MNTFERYVFANPPASGRKGCHMVLHQECAGVENLGAHAFTEDPTCTTNWVLSQPRPSHAYGPEFEWDNGSTTVFSSRERPQMVINADGLPEYLSNGMVSTSWAGNTFTLVAPINTKPAAPFECSTEWDCTLSGECVNGKCVCDKPWYGSKCQSLKLKPAKLAAPFVVKKTPNHFTWGCAPFLANDGTGRVCMYFTWLVGWDDGNNTRTVPITDTLSGSLGMACAASVEGPYAVTDPVALPFRPGQFDNSYLENAVMTYSAYDEGYLLSYTTSPPGIARNTLNWEGNGGNISGLQDIGIAFSKNPMQGEWKRLNRTILKPYTDGFEGAVQVSFLSHFHYIYILRTHFPSHLFKLCWRAQLR